MGYTFHTRARGRSVTSVQHQTLPEMFCDVFIPLPDSSVTSVSNIIPYRKYPHPTEHNLAKLLHVVLSKVSTSSSIGSGDKIQTYSSNSICILVYALHLGHRPQNHNYRSRWCGKLKGGHFASLSNICASVESENCTSFVAFAYITYKREGNCLSSNPSFSFSFRSRSANIYVHACV